MNPVFFSRRLARGVYRMTRLLVGILSVLVVLAIVTFVFLRIYGVPEPLLREVMRRINAAGIPVELDGITLTFHGWRADNVRYYSANPDDLEPLFAAEKVYFSLRNSRLRHTAGSDALNLDVRAVTVNVSPAIEWGVAIPKESPSRRIDEVDVSLRFMQDRILVSHGKIDWLGSQIRVNGTILKRKKTDPEPADRAKTLLPVTVTEQLFSSLEEQLSRLTLENSLTVDVEFSIDTADYSATEVTLGINAEAFTFDGVEFSGIEIGCSYTNPVIRVKHAGLFQGKRSLLVNGAYNLDSGVAQASLYNSITAGEPLQLLPESVRDLLARLELRFDHLPLLELNFGPAPAKSMLNRLSGTFSIRGAGYKGIEIDVLQGRLKRSNRRLEFTQLQGSVLGQEHRQAETGSSMHGGTASGSAFWDGKIREFGVDADFNFDPNLLVRALAPVDIATNIISRFQFRDRPPRGHLRLGSNVDDWRTFYIDIQAMANNVAVQGVEFSSVNATETYRNGTLRLDPVAAMRGSDFIKGSAALDFRASTASFDVLTSLNPADLEDLIYPDLKLFGRHIEAGGDVRIETRGVFDWKRMRQTDFSAVVRAERLELPVAVLDGFSAEIVGDGPEITVTNAAFNLYGGNGEGNFSMQWNPPRRELPYEIDISFTGADFNQCLAYVLKDRPVTVSGQMEGSARITDDFSTNFFAAASGKGFVEVGDGQLADMPLFEGFSRLVRKVFPSFKVFSITSLRGNFEISDGVISSQDAYFGGDIISARGRGVYDPVNGFDAYVQAQVLSEGRIQKMVQVITDPIMKLLEMKLEGKLGNPTWELENF